MILVTRVFLAWISSMIPSEKNVRSDVWELYFFCEKANVGSNSASSSNFFMCSLLWSHGEFNRYIDLFSDFLPHDLRNFNFMINQFNREFGGNGVRITGFANCSRDVNVSRNSVNRKLACGYDFLFFGGLSVKSVDFSGKRCLGVLLGFHVLFVEVFLHE